MTLAEFLLARISEDELTAQAAITDETGRWDVYYAGQEAGYADVKTPEAEYVVEAADGHPSSEQAAHIAKHDPGRVLAECAAKRHMVKAWTEQAASR